MKLGNKREHLKMGRFEKFGDAGFMFEDAGSKGGFVGKLLYMMIVADSCWYLLIFGIEYAFYFMILLYWGEYWLTNTGG